MSSFYAYDFVFDGVSSREFDLKIITFDDGSLFDGVGSSNVNILTQKVMRKAKPYFLGVSQEPVLEFPLTFGSEENISGMERDLISKWLFGRSTYKKLQIIQDDLLGAYFYCFLTEPEPLYIGGLNYAFQCQAVCDSPFAYSYPKTISGSYVSKAQQSFNVYNDSSEDDYLYPNVNFKISSSGSAFSLINSTDDNRAFEFGLNASGGLSNNEEIGVNNDLQIIESSTGLMRISKFNKNWLRLLPGINQIAVNADIDWFQITYNERKKIGG